MVWERSLPALIPFLVLAALIGVAAQWGLFKSLSAPVHFYILMTGLAIALIASYKAILRFRWPSFSEANQRAAMDNDLKPEQLLALRHERHQPLLRVGKAKAGIAQADPWALRYVAIIGFALGLWVLGPVPLAQIKDGFDPFKHQHYFVHD
jgi:Domain of unknown function (DUF4175)